MGEALKVQDEWHRCIDGNVCEVKIFSREECVVLEFSAQCDPLHWCLPRGTDGEKAMAIADDIMLRGASQSGRVN